MIELLVVIGIIAVLIALLMPSLSAARSHATTLQCGANLHAIGHAVQQYANDFKGRVPRGYFYSPWYERGHILWAEAFSRYLGPEAAEADLTVLRDRSLARQFRNIGVYQCPSFPNEDQPLDYVVSSWMPGGDSTGDNDALIPLTKLRRPGDIVYVTEANQNRQTEYFAFHDVWDSTQLPSERDGTPRINARVLNDQRHRGRINLLYLDGHVVTKHYREVKRKDFDPLWTDPLRD